jgi:hypothetical protein
MTTNQTVGSSSPPGRAILNLPQSFIYPATPTSILTVFLRTLRTIGLSGRIRSPIRCCPQLLCDRQLHRTTSRTLQFGWFRSDPSRTSSKILVHATCSDAWRGIFGMNGTPPSVPQAPSIPDAGSAAGRLTGRQFRCIHPPTGCLQGSGSAT